MESKASIPRMMVFIVMFNFLPSSLGATDFCIEPLGMKRRIILDEQITESSVLMNLQNRKGFNARLDNYDCWCSHTSSQSNQWVKVDLRYPMSIRGIKIQGDYGYPPNYIKKFQLRYSTDGTNFLYKTSDAGMSREDFDGATGQSQTIVRMFNTKPFAARYFEFRPTQFNGNDVCVRFELYGCVYVCNQGLGFEHGSVMPLAFTMTSSSNKNGKQASSARLNDPSSCWCAQTNNVNQYLQIDFGKPLTITGLAVQGNPTADSWVKDFYFEYGMSVGSLATYQEYGTNKVSVQCSCYSKIDKLVLFMVDVKCTFSCYPCTI